jgi:hypothetical protein
LLNQRTRSITSANEIAVETGQSAGQVLESARELSRQSETLRGEVDKFLEGIPRSPGPRHPAVARARVVPKTRRETSSASLRSSDKKAPQ